MHMPLLEQSDTRKDIQKFQSPELIFRIKSNGNEKPRNKLDEKIKHQSKVLAEKEITGTWIHISPYQITTVALHRYLTIHFFHRYSAA